MGYLSAIYDAQYDPTDATNPAGAYTPYTFQPIDFQQDMGFARRETVMVIPGMDDVLDYYAGGAAPMDVRPFSWTFRVFTAGNVDAAHDLLMAQIAPDRPVRLVYLTDSGIQWFTTAHLRKTEEVNDPKAFFWQDFKVTWRIRSDWRMRYPDSTSDIWGVNDGAWGTNDGNWSAGVALSAAPPLPNNFTLDATGVAGSTLPTLDDYAPLIYVQGPIGGVLGFTLVNTTATHPDVTGAPEPTQITVPVQLPTANDVAVLDMGARSFTADGVPIRPTRPAAQRYWWKVRGGVLNGCYLQSLGGAEVQAINITGTGLGGTFTLTFGGQTTTALAPTASAATVQAALIALSSIGSGNVTCTGGPLGTAPLIVTFTGTLSPAAQALITLTSSITGTGVTAAVTEVIKGLLAGGTLTLLWFRKRA